MTPPKQLDQKFWTFFKKNIWEQKTLLLKNVRAPILQISHQTIFELLLSYSDSCRKLKDPEGFKFYIAGLQVGPQDVLQILPVKQDKSLIGYHDRMQKMFKDYCLVCDELLKVSDESQAVLTDFTEQLYRSVGWPNRFSEMGLYLGNYRKTPFGVHVDGCGVFSFPVVGSKKFRIWKPEFAKKNPSLNRALKYSKYNKNSKVLTASPGDLVYWPSSAWHIAESSGAFSATWSLGVWVDQSHATFFNEVLNDLIKNKMGTAGLTPTTMFTELYSASGEVTKLPDTFKNSMKLLQDLNLEQLENEFLRAWMGHISKKGLKSLPFLKLNLQLNSIIGLRHSKILWQRKKSPGSSGTIAFGGESIECGKNSKLIKLVKTLNSGEKCLISECLKGPNLDQDFCDLKKLAAAGAFQKFK